MNTLIISQTIFYIVSSLAIVVLAVLISFAVYQIIKILKNTRDISDDVGQIYHKTKTRIKKLIGLGKKRD